MGRTKSRGGLTPKPVIMLVNTGTFCDGSLMEPVLRALTSYRVVLLTDENIVPADKALFHRVFTYATPSFVYLDPRLGAADTSRSVVTWGLTHPVQAQQVNAWIGGIAKSVASLEREFRPAAVLCHFSLLAALLQAERKYLPNMFGAVPHVLLYFYPAVPNATVPWIFDARLRSPSFRLYHPSSEPVVLSSWASLLARVGNGGGLGDEASAIRGTSCALRDMRHLLCWDATLTAPLQALVPGVTATYLGGALTHARNAATAAAQAPALPPAVSEFLADARRRRASVAFVSFGSFGGEPLLRSAALRLRGLLSARGYAVLLHDTSKTKSGRDSTVDLEVDGHVGREESGVMVHRGFVAYDALAPHLGLVVFTGSMCLQLTCLQARVPMLFVPFLTEQYFWSKNYEFHTGVPYVDVNDEKDGPGEERAVKLLHTRHARVRAHLARVSRSLASNDARKNMTAYVRELLAEERRRAKDDALQPHRRAAVPTSSRAPSSELDEGMLQPSHDADARQTHSTQPHSAAQAAGGAKRTAVRGPSGSKNVDRGMPS